MHSTRFFVLLLLVLLPVSLLSQKFNFRQYSIGEGLPHSSVYSMLEDSRGYLWLGTDGGGISRTDGIRFETFDKSNGLNGNTVRALFEDSQNRIWLGTDHGLNVYDGNTIQAYQKDQILAVSAITTISEDLEGRLLVGTGESGLFILDWEKDTLIKLDQQDGLISNMVIDIEVADDNTYCLAMAKGISLISHREGQYRIDRLIKGFHIPSDLLVCAARDHDGNIWFGGRDGGLFFLDLENKDRIRAQIPEHLDFLAHETIWDIHWTDSASCWLATERLGLIRINQTEVERSITRENGLPTNQVYRILEDRLGGIWLATLGNGILRFRGELFSRFGLNPNRNVIDVYDLVEEEPGTLLAATDEGLFRISDLRGSRTWSMKISTPGIRYGSSITSLAQDTRDRVWLGTRRGLYILQDGDTRYSEYNQGMSSNRINALFKDRENRLWIGTDNGLNVCFKGSSFVINESNGLINNEVQAFHQDQAGRVWIATLGGLAMRDGDLYRDFDLEEGLLTLQVHSLESDKAGRIWIGTFGGGLYVMDPDADTIKISAPGGSELLSSVNIYALAWEDDRHLIAGHESGFDRITLEDDSIVEVIQYDPGDGFCEGSINLNAILKASSGKLWFGTSKSLVAYDQQESPLTHLPPMANIYDLRLDYEVQDWGDVHTLSPWTHLPKDLMLHHDQDHLTFDYTAVHFTNPEDLEFSYFLEGQSSSWSPWTTGRNSTFQALRPGSYTFRLKARTKFGTISEESAYSFRIKPPFWFTPWFIISMIILLALTIVFAVRLRLRALRREKVRLEKIVELRTREIRKQKEHIEEQRDVVVKQQEEITDSIRYARRIQSAILPEEELLREVFQDFFILLKPQHIVSGDFYWMGRKGDHLVFTASDCTGHGVPGAFMSMLGVSFLNKIVLEEGIVEPDKILNALRDNIMNVFHQTHETEGQTMDGMELALCSYDTRKQKLSYAGAMNPLYQIRMENGEYQLQQHKANKMPAAIYAVMDPFTKKEIEVQKGDCLYMFSDGYSDQFGGARDKRFLTSRFRKMLLSHQEKDMDLQKEAIMNELDQWMNPENEEGQKKEYTQTDDILVMGIRI